ncbi:MAG: toll/interleukin-1 receptor domain-containing protein [Nitrospirae bacterium]|nr:toll/interleukin-1 receptor domain-containing protein [Nitrospirota bacterium]
MANQEQLDIIKQGSEVWNQWRKTIRRRQHPDLRDSNLSGLDLKRANLSETDLNRANLRNVDFCDADLRDADLGDADLMYANLTHVNLSNANLCGSDISGANLAHAIVKGTEFADGWVGSTTFLNVDLGSARGLDSLKHFAPSIIGVDTLYLSADKIPEGFLRGCGLNDWQIEVTKLNNPDLSPEKLNDIIDRVKRVRSSYPIQQKNLFISYSHADADFVETLEAHLKSNHILYWRDIHDATAGPLNQVIDRAMRRNPTVLLILSRNSINSDWVEYEAQTARELEKELDRHVLCPIALDDSWKDSRWSAVLRSQIKKYNILDFSSWKTHQTFLEQFDRLIGGLEIYYRPNP